MMSRGALAPPLRLSHLRGNDGAREACEAAWDFFGGVFKVIIPDNTKAIIIDADPLTPRSRRPFSNTPTPGTFTSTPHACGRRVMQALHQ